jgi:hypothetical protein
MPCPVWRYISQARVPPNLRLSGRSEPLVSPSPVLEVCRSGVEGNRASSLPNSFLIRTRQATRVCLSTFLIAQRHVYVRYARLISACQHSLVSTASLSSPFNQSSQSILSLILLQSCDLNCPSSSSAIKPIVVRIYSCILPRLQPLLLHDVLWSVCYHSMIS